MQWFHDRRGFNNELVSGLNGEALTWQEKAWVHPFWGCFLFCPVWV